MMAIEIALGFLLGFVIKLTMKLWSPGLIWLTLGLFGLTTWLALAR